ncbi:MAG TPA: hypothetical protein VLB79_08975 [Solirubrobacterales bacterium]|nr:hypothetical protein [Solirubrobacterales bacterium]
MRIIINTFRPRRAIAFVVASLLLLPSAAAAQTGDPSIGTPQANQYEIPVQAGRHDAAPPKDRGGSGGGSLYRSNNNFGSSSVVPGDPGGGGGPAGGAGAGGGGGGVAAGAAGAGAAGAAGVAAAANSNDQNPLDTGSPSTGAAYTTLPLIIILGIVIGIAGVRMRRRAEV